MVPRRALAFIGSLILFAVGVYTLITLSRYGMHHELSAWISLGVPGILLFLSLALAIVPLSGRLRSPEE